MGDSRTPFLFLAFSSTSNIVLDIVFVKTFGMGVEGVAWATFLCQGVSCILSLGVVFLRLRDVKTEAKIPLFSISVFKKFVKIAVPSILQQSFISVGNIVIQRTINGFGPGVMAGYSAAVKLNNLVITSFTTIGNGISNYAAQNIGAKKIHRIKSGFRAGVKIVWIISIPLILIYFFAGRQLLYLFMSEPTDTAVQTGINYLRILSPFYLVISAKLIADGVLRGNGMMGRFMVSTFSDLILRVAFAVLLSKTFLGATGIWCAWPIGWTVATLMSVDFYHRGLWNGYNKSY